MNDEIRSYLKILKFNSFIYDDDLFKDLLEEDMQEILSDTFVESISTLVKTNEDTRHLDPKSVDNVLDIVSFVRAKKGNTKELAEIITKLNSFKYDKYVYFYRDQYLKRSGMLTERTRRKYDLKCFTHEEVLKELRFSLMLDYDILTSLTEDTDEEFLDMEEILVSDYFINTINAAIYDCPQIFKVNKAKERTKYILNKIEELSHQKEQADALSRYRAHTLMKQMKK